MSSLKENKLKILGGVMYRQGDLILIPVKNVTVNGEVKMTTLASGEDSGHFHAIMGAFDDKFLRVDVGTDLVVNPPGQSWRHNPIFIPPGTYEVRIQREYTPAGARKVED
jgi:hypothetical protein